MSGNCFELGFFRRLERAAAFPGIFHGWDDPEVAVGIAHDPVFRAGAVHEQGCHAAGRGDQFSFLLVDRRIEAI